MCEYLKSGIVKLILYGHRKFEGDSVPLKILSPSFSSMDGCHNGGMLAGMFRGSRERSEIHTWSGQMPGTSGIPAQSANH